MNRIRSATADTPLHPAANFETIGGGAAGGLMNQNRDGSRQPRTPMKWMLTMLAAGACAGALTALAAPVQAADMALFEDGRERPSGRAMAKSGLRLLPKTLFIFFAEFRRNESAPLALPE
jgi:hypothetical protein